MPPSLPPPGGERVRKRPSVRASVRHPITGKKLRLHAATQARLDQRLRVVENIRDALASGSITESAADEQIRRLQGRAKVTLERVAASYLARTDISDNTRRDVLSFLRGAAAPLAPQDLSALEVNTIKSWLGSLRARQVAPGTVSCYWRRLRALASHAVDRRWIGRLPWGDFKPRLSHERAHERESARTPEELARLLYAARLLDWRESYEREIEAKIVTTVAAGLRQGELAGLKWSDLDAAECTITIARQYAGAPPKMRRRPKRLAVPREVLTMLERYRLRLEAAELYAPTGPVFPSPAHSRRGAPAHYAKGEVLTRRAVRAVVALSGLPNKEAWSAHSLRDTFASLELLGHGGDLAATADRTRHRSLSALARYLRAARRGTVPPGFEIPELASSTSQAPLLLGEHRSR